MNRPADFRAVVRHGRRSSTSNTVVYVTVRDGDGPSRFGFIVPKAVGNAVIRNRVRRRLRAAAADALSVISAGHDVVVRALPASARADWTTLHSEVTEGVMMRAQR